MKRAVAVIVLLAILCVLSLAVANYSVWRRSERVYGTVVEIPEREYGLLLGTIRIVDSKYLNQFYLRRIEAACELYKAGKIHKIIVSGDNSRPDYNEPEDMRRDLLQNGVSDDDILCDYAGRRTLDSVVRAKTVFGCREVTVISQRDHCCRALFIADGNGLDAIGYEAGHVSRRYRIKHFVREPAACLLAWIDVKILHRKPYFEQ